MPFDPIKSAQTIAFFALQNGEPIHVLKAVKLVYLADRESLRLRGHPIQDEPRVSMNYGPVNSKTLNYINGDYGEDDGGWSKYLSDRADHKVGLARRKPVQSLEELDALSARERDILQDVWERFGQMDRFELAQWTHENVPEWEHPDGSMIPIRLQTMMAAVGLDHSIERARELESLDSASDFLASL